MNSPLTRAVRQALICTPAAYAWNDSALPQTRYETSNYGHAHSWRRGEVRTAPSFFEVGLKERTIDHDLRLVQTIFCSPRSWWQQVIAHPYGMTVPVFFHRGHLAIGPAFTKDGPVCPTCSALRLGQAYPHPAVFTSLISNPIMTTGDTSQEVIDSILEQESLAHFVLDHLNRLKSGLLASLNLLSEEEGIQWHRILSPPGHHPLHEVSEEHVQRFGIPEIPWSNVCDAEEGGTFPLLLDAFVGPLLSTVSTPTERDEPETLSGHVTITGHLGSFTRWHPDVNGSGLNFSGDTASRASIGEAVERYSGNYIPLDRLLTASENALTHGGQPHVPFARFLQFTDTQHSASTWPFAAYHPNDDIPWVDAKTLGMSGNSILLPAESVYLNLTRVTRCPSHLPVPLAGIAAHTTYEAAQTAALLEVIERDATMRFWHGGHPARQLVDLPHSVDEELVRGVPPSIKQWFLLLGTDLPVFVVAGCLFDAVHDVLVIGFAARALLADALKKSIAEAWQLRRLSLLLLDQHSRLWEKIQAGHLPMPTRPFRADRRYREAFRSDYSDMHQLAYNLQYYLDPDSHRSTLERLSGEACAYRDAEKGQGTLPNEVVTRCVEQLAQQGEQVYCVDLSTRDMRTLGFTTVRVVCPGLIGNTPAAFIPLAHPRLQRTFLEHGTRPYLAPMPHA